MLHFDRITEIIVSSTDFYICILSARCFMFVYFFFLLKMNKFKYTKNNEHKFWWYCNMCFTFFCCCCCWLFLRKHQQEHTKKDVSMYFLLYAFTRRYVYIFFLSSLFFLNWKDASTPHYHVHTYCFSYCYRNENIPQRV